MIILLRSYFLEELPGTCATLTYTSNRATNITEDLRIIYKEQSTILNKGKVLAPMSSVVRTYVLMTNKKKLPWPERSRM